MTSRHDRFRGCLLGGALGDALGYPIEFDSAEAIDRRFPSPPDALPLSDGVALVSDDTQMTLFTAEGLIRAQQRAIDRGFCDPAAVILNAYRRWYFTQTREWKAFGEKGWLVDDPRLHASRAPGNTCLGALGSEAPAAGPVNDSKGCGSVMRVAPVGLVARSREVAFELGCRSGALTHGHPSGVLSAGFMAAVVHDLAHETLLAEAVAQASVCLSGQAGRQELDAVIRRVGELAADGPPSREQLQSLGGGWVAEEALGIGLLCALTADGSSPQGVKAALWRAVAHGGDSDSTGSITGQLLGTLVGAAGLPGDWLDVIELRDVMERLASDLAAIAVGRRLSFEAYPPH